MWTRATRGLHAIPDATLGITPNDDEDLFQAIPTELHAFLDYCKKNDPVLLLWEFKDILAGSLEMMQLIAQSRPFVWTSCTVKSCRNSNRNRKQTIGGTKAKLGPDGHLELFQGEDNVSCIFFNRATSHLHRMNLALNYLHQLLC